MIIKTKSGIELLRDDIEKYHEATTLVQRMCDGPIRKMPKLPKTDEPTKRVLKAYANMALCWSRVGGVVPDPFQFLDLLDIMGRNRICFNRTKRR